MDTSGTPASLDIARFTDSNTIEGRSYAELKADLGLEAGTDFYSKSAEDSWRNSVTQTEMGYLNGTTSDIQTQINSKLDDQTIGIADDNLLEVDGSPNSGEWGIFTANGIDGKTHTEARALLDLEPGTDFVAKSGGEFSGNIGIGTSPNKPLHILDSTAYVRMERDNDTTGNAGFQLVPNGTISPSNVLWNGGIFAGSPDYIFRNYDGTDTDVVLTLDINNKVSLASGTAVNEFSTDGTMAGDSDDAVPTEKAVKAYADSVAAGGGVPTSTFTQDSGVIVGTGAGTFQEETGATLRTSLRVRS